MKYVALDKVDNNILIQGSMCITNMRELYTALVDKDTEEIELRKSFVDLYFTYTSLCDFVENAATIAPTVRVFVADAVHDKVLSVVRDLMTYNDASDFLYAMQYNPDRILSTIHALCKSYLDNHAEAVEANNKIANMLIQIESLNSQLEQQKKEYKQLSDTQASTQARLHALVSRVNFRYEKAIKEEEMFTLSENKYSHILYIKEITRVHYMDTLLYYLGEVLKTVYSMPVRQVVIEPFYSYGCDSRYPGFAPHWDLTYKDVYSGNILMAGFQPKLMKDILQNSNHVNFLIVLDRGGYRVPHISNGNVSTLYTVSDLKDAPENIDLSQIISYSEDTQYIPYIEDFDSLSLEDRIQKYSSMDILKNMIKLLEEEK